VTGQAEPSRVHAIDGFRAYAILCVVAFHLLVLAGALEAGTTTTLITWGVLGNVIDAFFIVSGFVLFLAVVRRGGEVGSLRSFALGRGARLIPPYWITLVLMLALLAFVATPPAAAALGVQGTPDIPSVIVHFAGLQMPARMLDSNLLIGFATLFRSRLALQMEILALRHQLVI